MIVSHWGIFPGFLRPFREADGSFPIDPRPDQLGFEPVDWETFLAAFDAIERAEMDDARDQAERLRRAGRLH